MEAIKALPKTEIIFDFKCVEGWDQIQHWAGVRFIDFIKHYKLDDLDFHAICRNGNAKRKIPGWAWIWKVPCIRKRFWPMK